MTVGVQTLDWNPAVTSFLSLCLAVTHSYYFSLSMSLSLSMCLSIHPLPLGWFLKLVE